MLEQATWGDAILHVVGTSKLLWNAALVSALQGQHRPQGQIRQSLPVGPNSGVACLLPRQGPSSKRNRTSLSASLHLNLHPFNIRMTVRTEL